MKEDKEKEKIEDKASEISSKFHWILDAGHGGLHPETDIYQTRGKRSPTFPPTRKKRDFLLVSFQMIGKTFL